MAGLPALPDGWVQQYDTQSQHPFWVDTWAKPPRASWIHPYDDEQFLRQHPDVRDQIAAARANAAPPPYGPEPGRRNSFSGPSSSSLNVPVQNRNALSQPGTPPYPPMNQSQGFMSNPQGGMGNQPGGNSRGLFGNFQQQPYGYGGPGYNGQPAYGQPGAYAQPAYGPPPGDPYAVSGGRYGGLGGGGLGNAGRLAMPLVGGMAGGLILGDLLDHRHHHHRHHHHGGLLGGGPGFGGGFGGPLGGGPFGDRFGGPFDQGFGGGFGPFEGRRW